MKRIVAFIFLFLSCVVSYAAETGKPIEVNGDQVEFLPNEKKVIGTGNVSIDYDDIKLTCDKIVVYTETKDAKAEGNVVLKMPTGALTGNRVDYNFETKKGVIADARAKSGDWYAVGEKIDIISRDTYKVINGYITSCDLPRPHYKISSKSVMIYPGDKVVAKDVTVKVGGVPIAYLPRYHFSINTKWPTVEVIPGRKKKWGFFALNSYRYELDEDNSLTLRLDERERWGLGEGFDYKYALNGLGGGILRTYYTNQRDMDRGEPLRAEAQRWRVQLRHKWDMNDHAAAIMEYHKLSDADMTKDFFYREEYDSEPLPESYLYLLRKESEYSFSFLTRKRVNRFQTVTERLPELRFDLKDQRLFNLPVYLKTDTSFSSLDTKAGDSADDTDVVRFDMYNKLSSPLRLCDFLSVTPFAGMRDTAYSKDANGEEDEFRTAFYTGVDLSTKLSRTYDGSFRHIATPTLKYEYVHEPSTPAVQLQQFDDIDAVTRTSKFTLGLENKIQVKRKEGDNLMPVDFGYLLITSDYLYKPTGMGSQFSNVKADLELTPLKGIRFESDTRYDPQSRDFQTWNNDFFIRTSERYQFGLGSRYWQDEETELTSELFYKLNNEWSFRTFGRYDLKEVEDDGHKIVNRFKEKELTVIKDLHCWIAEASVNTGRDGGTTVWFVMKLKASPKVPFDFKDYYPYPKQGIDKE
ncbi:MAG: LPS assembly protein LptD [Candidatus Omnitrophota bacterium]